MNTISPLEVFWTAIAIAGAGLSALNMYYSHVDYRDLRESDRNGVARIVAKGYVRNAIIRLTVLFIFALIGVASMALPNNPGAFTPMRILVTALLVLGEIGLVWASFEDNRDRLRVLEFIDGGSSEVGKGHGGEVQ